GNVDGLEERFFWGRNGESVKRGIGEGFFCLRFSPSPFLRFGAIAPQQADAARPRKNALLSAALHRVLQLQHSVLPLVAPLFHTHRPVKQRNMVDTDLPL